MTTMTSPSEYRAKVFLWAMEQGLTKIRLMIHQPKVAGTTEWTCDLSHLLEFSKTLERNAHRTELARQAYGTIPIADWSTLYLNPKPNDEECAFCRAMPTCPSVQGMLQAAAHCDFDVVAEDELAPDPSRLPPVDKATAMKAVPLMEAWCKSVRAEVERDLLAGRAVPGFGLELGRQGNRKWADEEAAEAYMRKTVRLKVDDVYQFKLRSPTQIEKLTKPAAKGLEPVLGQVQWERLTKMVIREDPRPSVRPASVIKTPYVPKPLEAAGFESRLDNGDESLA